MSNVQSQNNVCYSKINIYNYNRVCYDTIDCENIKYIERNPGN